MPMLNRDYRDMLSAFDDAGVEYLVVGAYALAAHGHPRATGDLDLWIRPEPSNGERVMRALDVFGAPLSKIERADLTSPGLVFQIGVSPRRIDLLGLIDVPVRTEGMLRAKQPHGPAFEGAGDVGR